MLSVRRVVRIAVEPARSLSSMRSLMPCRVSRYPLYSSLSGLLIRCDSCVLSLACRVAEWNELQAVLVPAWQGSRVTTVGAIVAGMVLRPHQACERFRE